MAYDDVLAARIREVVEGEPGLSEKAMFGGLAFLVAGNMAVAASGQGGLLLRIDPADAETLTREAHVRRFEMRGRAMDGGCTSVSRPCSRTMICAAGWRPASTTRGHFPPSRWA